MNQPGEIMERYCIAPHMNKNNIFTVQRILFILPQKYEDLNYISK
jgi:hypothetical protein